MSWAQADDDCAVLKELPGHGFRGSRQVCDLRRFRLHGSCESSTDRIFCASMSQVRQFKASVFQALAHPTRLRILEVLRDGELPVNAILSKIDRDQANISQHLANLRLRGLVVNRKEGNQVFYSVRDPILFRVMDLMRKYSTTHLNEHMALLKRFRAER